jgi:hypothetical protein
MATRKKARTGLEPVARALGETLGRTRAKVSRALEKIAELPEDDAVKVRRSRGGRTITVINRGGVTVGKPRKRGR